MPKRKRGEDDSNNFSNIQDPSIRTKASRFKSHFDHGVKTLTSQLKLARAFDRQKMSRRIKQAGKDASKVGRLNAELDVLKTLDASITAKNYLMKQCVRTKRIRESEAFSAVLGDGVEGKVKGSASVAEGNVLGRLFKSNPIGEVLPGIMKGIREVLDVDGEAGSRRVATQSANNAGRGDIDADSGHEFTGFSDGTIEDGPVSHEKESPEELDDDMLNAYESRLAASSDSDSESDIRPNGQNHERYQDDMSITSDASANLDQPSNQEDDEVSIPSTSDHENNDQSRTKSKPKSTTKPPKQTPSTALTAHTSFLPSLMHGGYYSGSDTDSASTASLDDPTTGTKPRKNRRGQRARRAIAEKKHGASAKHLISENGAEGVHTARQNLIASSNYRSDGRGRNEGWDPRRGAVANGKGTGRYQPHAQFRNGARGGRSTGANADPVNVNGNGSGKMRVPLEKRDAEKEKQKVKEKSDVGSKALHPSWEAAKKRKMEKASGVGSFAGKKITFD